VTNRTYDQAKLAQYREKAAELRDFSRAVEVRMDQAAESGEVADARMAFGELTLKTREFEEFRDTLTPAEIFIAKYNVMVLDDHTVSFVVPSGVAPIDILQEAQELVTDRDLIWPERLTEWSKDPTFTTPATESERICIDGHVPNSINKNRAKQEKIVGKDNLPSLSELAIAFAVNWIATGEPLFRWNKSGGWSYVVRAAGGALDFLSVGLSVVVIYDDHSDDDVAVSSRAPGIKKTR